MKKTAKLNPPATTLKFCLLAEAEAQGSRVRPLSGATKRRTLVYWELFTTSYLVNVPLKYYTPLDKLVFSHERKLKFLFWSTIRHQAERCEAYGTLTRGTKLAASDFPENFRTLWWLYKKIPKPKNCCQNAFFYLNKKRENWTKNRSFHWKTDQVKWRVSKSAKWKSTFQKTIKCNV